MAFFFLPFEMFPVRTRIKWESTLLLPHTHTLVKALGTFSNWKTELGLIMSQMIFGVNACLMEAVCISVQIK